jgi:uncharacterized membrane protein
MGHYSVSLQQLLVIITDFCQLQFNSAMPPFDITRAYNIYARTLERYTLLVMAKAKAHRFRTILLARQRSDNLPSTRMVRRTNKTIAHRASVHAGRTGSPLQIPDDGETTS